MRFAVCLFLIWAGINPSYGVPAALAEFPFLTQAAHSDSSYIVGRIRISGNRITRSYIIFRELLFKSGDTIAGQQQQFELFAGSTDNLNNTSLFHNVEILKLPGDSSVSDIEITVQERWYIWPFPIFEISDRNFNSWWEKKDLSRINYGFYLVQENFRGRKESLKLLLRFGYDRKISLLYKIPYINQKQTIGLTVTTGYSSNHEQSYITEANKQLFYKDPEKRVKSNCYLSSEISYRPSIYTTHALWLSYDRYSFADTLIRLNPEFSGSAVSNFFSAGYILSINHRDFNTYPLKGYFFSIEAEKKGFGVMNGEKNVNILTMKTSFRRYVKAGRRFYFSSGGFLKATLAGNYPYFLLKGLGYGSETVRSYEYYVVDCLHYGLLKNQMKYCLLDNRKIHLKFIRSKKFNTIPVAFYLNLFFDTGYALQNKSTMSNPLSNQWLTGTGGGLDFVTYYDQVIRLEYSINRMLEHGLFLHFTAPF